MPTPISLIAPPARLARGGAGWPAALEQLARPPGQLFIAGQLPDLTRAVAIVGTRYASPDALAFTRELASELTSHDAVIVSGGAAGIDAEAHRGALEAAGRTVAVLATGLVHAYPPNHGQLFSEIAQTGALISELDRVTRPAGWAFLQRNRLIAALASLVVVVQAPARSGALSTARWAKSLNRRVLVVPSAPWDPRGTGSLELFRAGSEICTSAADILSLAPFGIRRTRSTRASSGKDPNALAGLEPRDKAVWQRVRQGACHPDHISAVLDMPAAEVQEALLTLVLHGLCERCADGSYLTRR
jgi:DNA processing protein